MLQMSFLSKLCFLCLSTYKNLKLVLNENSEGMLIQKELKCCLPEMDVDFHSDIPKYVCNNCMSKLECFYEFKQICLRNNTYLKSYFQTLTSTDEPYKHFLSVTLPNIEYQNKLQTVGSDQTLTTVGSDDELQTNENENRSRITGAVFKNEVQCPTILNANDSHIFEEQNNIVVKEECLTSDDNADDKFYQESVISIKCDPVSNDSDVSVSSIEDIVHEDSKCSISSSENNSIHSEETKGKDKIKETKTFQCDICSKKYVHKISLEYHLKVHAGIKDFICTICNKSFFLKTSLIAHENIHTGIRNFECLLCKRKFMHKSGLLLHKKSHTGIKSHECSICKKKFMDKSNLIRHEKIHSGNKNYECTICKKKFTQKSTLNRHEKSHTGIKNYECTVCSKKFMSKSNLSRHEKIHIDIKNECIV